MEESKEEIQQESIVEVGNTEIKETNDLVKEKKSNKKIIAIILVLIILVVAFIIFFLVKNNSNKKENSINKESNSLVKDTSSNKDSNSNTQDTILDDTNTNTNEQESNTNTNSNSNKKEYLDLSYTPKYKQDISYSRPVSFTVGEINKKEVEAKIGIDNKKAYFYYSGKKIEIEGFNNVRDVLANENSSCAYSEYWIDLFILTEEREIYKYSVVLSAYPEEVVNENAINIPTTESQIIQMLNNASKDMKKMKLSKKYKELFLTGNVCGPGCGCGDSLVRTASDGEKYIISEGEIPLEKKYNYSAIMGENEYYVSLDGTIYAYIDFEDGGNKKFDFKPKYIFDDHTEIYVLSVDLYLYELDYDISNKKVKNSKVSKIAKINESNFIIYFEDGSQLELESIYFIKF